MKFGPIKTKSRYLAALKRIQALMDARPGTPAGDELELLGTLVDLYEKRSYPVEASDALGAIRFRMEQAGLRQQDLVPYLGSRSKVSEVLSGKRRLSLNMIRALHHGLGIPAEVLIQDESFKGAEDPPCKARKMRATGSRRLRSYSPPHQPT